MAVRTSVPSFMWLSYKVKLLVANINHKKPSQHWAQSDNTYLVHYMPVHIDVNYMELTVCVAMNSHITGDLTYCQCYHLVCLCQLCIGAIALACTKYRVT